MKLKWACRICGGAMLCMGGDGLPELWSGEIPELYPDRLPELWDDELPELWDDELPELGEDMAFHGVNGPGM